MATQFRRILALLAALPAMILTVTIPGVAAQYDSHQLTDDKPFETPTPTNAIEHNNRGVELGARGMWALAAVEAEAAVKASPESDPFRTNLSVACSMHAQLLAKDQRIPEAIDFYRKALFADFRNKHASAGLDKCIEGESKDPKSLAYRLSLAEQAEQEKLYPVAAVEYKVCTQLLDSAENNYRLGRCLVKADSLGRAQVALKSAMEKTWAKGELVDKAACQALLDKIEGRSKAQ